MDASKRLRGAMRGGFLSSSSVPGAGMLTSFDLKPAASQLPVVIMMADFRFVVCNVRVRNGILERGRLPRMFCDGAHVRLLRGISGRKHESFEVASHHSNQVISSFQLGRKRFLTWHEDVISHLALYQFCHQAIQCPTTGSDELQDLFALVFFSGERSFNRLDLALTADPAQHPFSVFAGMGQADLYIDTGQPRPFCKSISLWR